MDDSNPYASPAEPILPASPVASSVSSVMGQGWAIFVQQFPAIMAIVLVVWGPLALISCYADAYLIDPEDIMSSIWLGQLLENFFGIIGTAAIISIGVRASRDVPAAIGEVLLVGLRSWPRMVWTRILTSLIIVLGLLLLIVPGIYLMVRLLFAEPLVVAEGASTSDAIGRSFELTRDHFWFALRLGAMLFVVLVVLFIAVSLPTAVFPQYSHWLIEAGIQLLTSMIISYSTLCVVCALRQMSGSGVRP